MRSFMAPFHPTARCSRHRESCEIRHWRGRANDFGAGYSGVIVVDVGVRLRIMSTARRKFEPEDANRGKGGSAGVELRMRAESMPSGVPPRERADLILKSISLSRDLCQAAGVGDRRAHFDSGPLSVPHRRPSGNK
jgi:hypothetical protein